MTRTVWAHDPDNLASPLHYAVEVREGISRIARRPPSDTKVLAALEARAGERTTRAQIEELTGLHGQRVKGALSSLAGSELIESKTSPGKAGIYWIEPTTGSPGPNENSGQ